MTLTQLNSTGPNCWPVLFSLLNEVCVKANAVTQTPADKTNFYFQHSTFTWILSTSLAQPTTFIPNRTSSWATAAPIPTEAPVTSATRPLQRSISTRTQGTCSEHHSTTVQSAGFLQQNWKNTYECQVSWTQHSEGGVAPPILCCIQVTCEFTALITVGLNP